MTTAKIILFANAARIGEGEAPIQDTRAGVAFALGNAVVRFDVGVEFTADALALVESKATYGTDALKALLAALPPCEDCVRPRTFIDRRCVEHTASMKSVAYAPVVLAIEAHIAAMERA